LGGISGVPSTAPYGRGGNGAMPLPSSPRATGGGIDRGGTACPNRKLLIEGSSTVEEMTRRQKGVGAALTWTVFIISFN